MATTLRNKAGLNMNDNKIVTSKENNNKNVMVLRYQPHKCQKEVHESDARWKIICAGRRFGKSLLCAADIINRCLSGKYTEFDQIAWIAPTNGVAQRGVEAFKLIVQDSPNIITWYKSAPVTATFINGVKVVFLSADNPDSLRGFGFSHIVIDEADYLDPLLWDAVIRPSLADKKGSMIAISTPRAKGTFFHKLYLQGLTGEYDYIKSFHFPSSVNPLIDKQEIEDARKTIPEKIFQREYLAEFTDTGGAVFQNIDKCIYQSNDNCTCKSNTILGIDLARHADWTVITALCAKCKKVKFIERFNNIDWTIQKDIIKRIYLQTETPTIYMDTTGVGDVVYDNLVSEGLKINPFHFSNSSKQKLINNLKLIIMEGGVSWNGKMENADILRYELECYEVQETRTGLITYNGRTGVNDDCVIALALACNGLSSFISPIVCPKETKKANDFTMHFVEVDNSFDFGDNNQVFFA